MVCLENIQLTRLRTRGMTGCEADPLNLWDLCNDVDQIREIRRVFIISFTPVGVYILAQGISRAPCSRWQAPPVARCLSGRLISSPRV